MTVKRSTNLGCLQVGRRRRHSDAVGDATVMPSAGVVAASVADIGVMALVVDIKGSVIASHSRDGADWTAYEDVSE